MKSLFSARVFSLVLGYGYALAVYLSYPLVRYYPLVDRWSRTDLADKTLGPAMSYYGWIATAAIPAVILGAIVPKSLGNRIPAVLFWIMPFVMLWTAWHNEQSWFH